MPGKVKVNYGRRSRPAVSYGVRALATTFGQERISAYSPKVGATYQVNSVPEFLVAQVLAIDPSVESFIPQPFTVDLIEKKLLRTAKEVQQARADYKGMSGPCLYTPDLGVNFIDRSRTVLEVKKEGFEGDDAYTEKLVQAKSITEMNGVQFMQVVLPADEGNTIYYNASLINIASQRMDLIEIDQIDERIEALEKGGALTMRDYCQGLNLTQKMMPVLLAKGYLKADIWTSRLDYLTKVFPAWGDLTHLQFLRRLHA